MEWLYIPDQQLQPPDPIAVCARCDQPVDETFTCDGCGDEVCDDCSEEVGDDNYCYTCLDEGIGD